MAKESLTRPVKYTALALSLGLLAVTWPIANAQGEQPFNQQKKIAELSQKIARREDKKEQELIDVEKARTQAIKQGDTKALDKIYADDFAGVTSGGRAVNKAQLMEVFKGVDPRLTFTTDELKARMFGETAIVTGLVTGRTQYGEVVSSFTFLHVYVKRVGRWQMVAGQSTNMPRQ